MRKPDRAMRCAAAFTARPVREMGTASAERDRAGLSGNDVTGRLRSTPRATVVAMATEEPTGTYLPI